MTTLFRISVTLRQDAQCKLWYGRNAVASTKCMKRENIEEPSQWWNCGSTSWRGGFTRCQDKEQALCGKVTFLFLNPIP